MATSTNTPMPTWINPNELDRIWLADKIGVVVQKLEMQDISNLGRRCENLRDCSTLLMHLDDSVDLVLKQQGDLQLSKQLGLAREGRFYKEFASQLHLDCLPEVLYAHGNMESGEKCIIMESLTNWVDSGILFGPGNPNNWSRDLPALVKKSYLDCPPPSASSVAKRTFVAIAQIHASFWQKSSLLEKKNEWLRGHAWLNGDGKETWEASQALIHHTWRKYDKDSSAIKWNPRVREAVESAVAGISWDSQKARLNRHGRWTLVHGDFWPGNVMVNGDAVRLIDWEMVGLGSGPQDLGQYVISNFDPIERRACEKEIVRAYYDELVRCGVKNDPDLWYYVWNEYTVGGVERWLWFLVYFLGQPHMVGWAQFFHNQIAEFMEDHDLTSSSITQPRP